MLSLAVRASALALLVPLFAGRVEAQEAASTAARERARTAFVAGTTAIEEGRWTDAITSFDEAYQLTGSPVALFNLGYAYRALGRYVEARDAFDGVLAADVDASSRAEAQALRDEVAARVAVLELRGASTGEVRIDTQSLDDADPIVLDLDPGPHSASLHAPGFEPWEWVGELAAGSRTVVDVVLVPLPVLQAEGGNVAEEPWLWIVIGAVVLAGAGVAIWAVDDAQQLRPEAMVLRL